MSTIAVDFDGTICNGGWPDIKQGKTNKAVLDKTVAASSHPLGCG